MKKLVVELITTSFKNYNNNSDNRIISGKKLNFYNLIKNIDKDYCPFYTDEPFFK